MKVAVFAALHRSGVDLDRDVGLPPPQGDGTHRETTPDRLVFTEDGKIKQVTPALQSIAPVRPRV